MGFFYEGFCMTRKPVLAVVCNGQFQLFCFAGFDCFFPYGFYSEKRMFPGFFLTAFFDAVFFMFPCGNYVCFFGGFSLGIIVFFLADWFDNGLVFHLNGSSVLPVPVVWSLFDVNGTGERNGWRV